MPRRLARSLKRLHLYRLEHRSLGHKAGCEIAPERHDELARQGHNGDALDAFAGIKRAPPIVLGELAVRLMPHPQPGHLDRGATGARVARLADALVAIGPAALPWTGRQPEIARDLTPIAEVLVEHLVGQRRCERRAEAFEPEQEFAALGPSEPPLGSGPRPPVAARAPRAARAPASAARVRA